MDKIKTIEVKNFKSLRHVVIDGCRRVNVFIGYPNVGKSNILEALGIYSLIDFKETDVNQKFIFEPTNISNLTNICRIQNDFEIFSDQDVSNIIEININSQFLVQIEKGENGIGIYFFKEGIKNTGGKLKPFLRSVLNIQCDSHFKIAPKFTSATFDLAKTSQTKSFKKFEYKSNFLVSAKGFGSELIYPFGENLLEVLQSDSNIRKEVSILFKEYGLKFAIDNSNQEIRLLKELYNDTIVIIPYHQIADTLKRLIFFKAAIYSNKDSVLIFEEPEAHMFPPYISKFTSDIAFDKNDNQYFISTHSPFVLNDFMEELEPEDLSIYAVGYANGETTINRLTDEQVANVYQYGVDLFFNLEEFLKDDVAQ